MIYFTRHGETEWNIKRMLCGITDVELTAKGIAQAEVAGKLLADKSIDLIITSPLKRANVTGKTIAKYTGSEVITDNRLIEQDFGDLDGADFDCEEYRRIKANFAVRFPNGESLLDVAARVYPFLAEVSEKYSEKNVLIVTHGAVCRVINSYFRDMTNEDFLSNFQGNCEVRGYEM